MDTHTVLYESQVEPSVLASYFSTENMRQGYNLRETFLAIFSLFHPLNLEGVGVECGCPILSWLM